MRPKLEKGLFWLGLAALLFTAVNCGGGGGGGGGGGTTLNWDSGDWDETNWQ